MVPLEMPNSNLFRPWEVSWPVHLQRRCGLRLENQPYPGQLFPCCLNTLTVSCVSYITPEWQADTGMSVFCFLWEQHHCFHEAILIQGHFANFDFIKIPPIMILSTFFFFFFNSMLWTSNPFLSDPQQYNCLYQLNSVKVWEVNQGIGPWLLSYLTILSFLNIYKIQWTNYLNLHFFLICHKKWWQFLFAIMVQVDMSLLPKKM